MDLISPRDIRGLTEERETDVAGREKDNKELSLLKPVRSFYSLRAIPIPFLMDQFLETHDEIRSVFLSRTVFVRRIWLHDIGGVPFGFRMAEILDLTTIFLGQRVDIGAFRRRSAAPTCRG